MLAQLDDLTVLMESDDAFAQFVQGSDNYSAEDGIAYRLSTRYLEITSAGHTGGGNVKSAVSFLGIRPFADVPYDLIPKIARILKTTALEKHVIYRTSDSEEDMIRFLDKVGEIFSAVCSNNKCPKYLIGFNNSGFDNFLLVQQAVYSNLHVKNVMVDAGNRLLSMTMSHFKVFDLYRVLMMSRKKAYYSLRDVESLRELFFKVKSVVANMTSLVLEDELTIASMTYKAFLASLDEETKENLPIVDLAMDNTIRMATVGGRTQVFHKGPSDRVSELGARRSFRDLGHTGRSTDHACAKTF
ncbi:hypothetical protein BGX30_004529 [Mortierella sp. GBA39]|nr:hypothetical protein BGX30_004529 [Mortierella sp. GBA39]